MLKDPIVITGIGMLDANGYTPDMCWQNIIAGNGNPTVQDDGEKYTNVRVKRAYTASQYITDLDLSGLHPRVLRTIPNTMAAAYHVANTAIKDSRLDVKNKNGACIYTSIGDSRESYRYVSYALDSGVPNLNPFKQLWATSNWMAGFVASEFELTGPNFHTGAACASGLSAMYVAKCLLDADPTVEFAIVGGADMASDRSFRYFFNLIQALSTEDTDNCSRPFDATRNGFVVGDGACSFVLERKSSALARGATIYAELAGFGNFKENEDSTSPNKDGLGSKTAMLQALAQAGIGPDQVDYVNAHATSTPAGDDVEANSVYHVFKRKIPVSSNKGNIGHTFAASGLLETAYSLLSMKYGIVPANKNCVEPCNTDVDILLANKTMPVNVVMKNSFAFNGRCISLLLKK
jgi:3-oxoacyl-[acyl-carrier-protein] synthase II